jgi:hypothetical protein
MRRWLVLTALVLAACGGGGDAPAADASVDVTGDVSDVAVTPDAAVCDVGEPPVPMAMLPQLSSSVVIAGGDAGAAPTASGGDPSGRWVMRAVTLYLPAQAQGQIRPATSGITGTGWMVVEGDRYRISTELELSIDTLMVGRLRSGQGVRGRGTFTQMGANLTLLSECATAATAPDGGAPTLALGISRDGAERGRLFVNTRGMLGSALLVFDMERIP